MNQILQQLQTIGKQKRLFPAEEIITSNLVDFESYIPEKLTNDEISQFEAALLGILNINGGNLSFSCSARIASCLIIIYKKDSSPKLWNLITAITKTPTVSLMYCASCVLKVLGKSSKSMLAGLMKVITKTDSSFIHPVLLLSRSCYQSSPIDVKDYNEKVFAIAKNALFMEEEQNQLAAIRVLRTMAKSESISLKKTVPLIKMVLDDPKRSPFVADEACYLVAKIAAHPLLKQKKTVETKEFQIGKKNESSTDFQVSFSILSQFQKQFTTVFRHFLDVLSPQFLYDNIKPIFDFVRKTQISDLSQILSLFGKDVRSSLFSTIAAEQPPSASQLACLRLLASDKAMAQEAAALSLQLCSSESEEARQAAGGYFSQIAVQYPEIAQSYIETSTLYLAFPPEDNPSLAADIRGFSIMASSILGGIEDNEKICESVASFIETFLKRALGGINIFSADYSAAFRLMAVLPKKFIPLDLASKSIDLTNKYLASENADLASSRTKNLLKVISCCIASHPYIQGTAQFISSASKLSIASCNAATLGMIMALPYAKTKNPAKVANRLISKVIILQAPDNYIQSLVPDSIPLAGDLLFHSIVNINTKGALYYRINAPTLVVRAVEYFPEFISSFSSEEATSILTSIIMSTVNITTSHLLILKLAKSSKANLLPANLHLLILETLSDTHNDIERMRISAEIVGLWAGMYGHTSEVIDKTANWKGIGKCLLYSSLFFHGELTDNEIIFAMHELDAMAKLPAVASSALFALSVLFDCCSARLSAMPLVGTQMSALTSIVHSKLSLNPYILFFIACCFSKLLPVLSPQGDSRDTNEMRLFVQMISQTSLPFTKQILFHTVRSVVAFARFLAKDFSMTFPSKPGVSLSLELSACGAFADYIRLIGLPYDLFDVVPKALLLLQKRDDPRPEEFIISVASTGKHVEKWVKIVKSVLSANALPGFINATVESLPQVKRCCLKVANKLVEKIQPGEMLDDIVTSATRAVETHITQLCEFGYPVLVQVLERFASQKCIDLYEPQFASSIRNGFICDMSYSAQFMMQMLALVDKKIKNDEDVTTLITPFAKGLETCEFNPYSTCVAALACTVARTSKKVEEQLSCLSRFAEAFAGVVKDAMSIFSVNKDWNRVTQFRQQYEKSLNDIFAGLAWLLPKQTKVTSNDFISFLIKESQCDEEWRMAASFAALGAVFEFHKGEIDEDLMLEALKAVSKDSMLPSFVVSCSHKVTGSQTRVWNQLIDYVSTTAFTPEAAALLIRAGNENEIAKTAKKIATAALKEGKIEIFTLLFEKTPLSIDPSLDALFENKEVSRTIKATVIERAMKRYKGSLTRNDVSEFLWTIFRKGGMQIIASTIIQNQEAGKVIFSFHSLKHIEELCLADITNASTYLQFIMNGITYINDDEEVLKAAARIAVSSIAKWGNESIKGGDIVTAAVQAFSLVKSKNKNAAKSGYFEASERDQQVSISNVESTITKRATKRKVHTLKMFSSKSLKKQDDEDEWQSL